MRLRVCFVAVFTFATTAQAAAVGQAADRDGQAAPQTSNKDKKAIVITGRRNGDRVLIDRRSYDVGRDVQSATGAIADVLRNLPSVDVDLQGNVTVRGQGNVTILVDGKPSAEFRGSTGAQLLQQIPASRFERVEVITTPSAAFASDGSTIINLVTKRSQSAGLTASLSGSADPVGRRNGALSLSEAMHDLTLSADSSARRDIEPFTRDERFVVTEVTAPDSGQQQTRGKGVYDTFSADGGGKYDLDAGTTVGLDLHHTEFRADTRSLEHIDQMEDDLPAEQVLRNDVATLARKDTEADLSYRRTSKKPETEFTVDLSHEWVSDGAHTRSSSEGAVASIGAPFENRLSHARSQWTDLKTDYARQIGSDAKLSAGYEGRIDDNLFVTSGGSGESPSDAEQPDPLFGDRFDVSQTILSSYATYEQPIGNLDVQLGTRIEWTRVGARDNGAEVVRTSYGRILPSLHLVYELNKDDKIRAAFTERVERPTLDQLDPFPVFLDSRHFRAGNPRLRAGDATSAELSFDHSKGDNSYTATIYYHDHRHGVSDVITDLGDGVLLSSPQNFGFSTAAGLEFTANGRLSRKIGYRLSGNAYRQHFNGGVAAANQQQSATVLNGKASVDWQLDTTSLVQLDLLLAGKQLLPQGFIDPIIYVGLGARHKFNSKLWGVIRVQDALASYRTHRVTETAGLRDVVDQVPSFRTIFFGFVYNFAGKRDHKPDLNDTLSSSN